MTQAVKEAYEAMRQAKNDMYLAKRAREEAIFEADRCIGRAAEAIVTWRRLREEEKRNA